MKAVGDLRRHLAHGRPSARPRRCPAEPGGHESHGPGDMIAMPTRPRARTRRWARPGCATPPRTRTGAGRLQGLEQAHRVRGGLEASASASTRTGPTGTAVIVGLRRRDPRPRPGAPSRATVSRTARALDPDAPDEPVAAPDQVGVDGRSASSRAWRTAGSSSAGRGRRAGPMRMSSGSARRRGAGPRSARSPGGPARSSRVGR